MVRVLASSVLVRGLVGGVMVRVLPSSVVGGVIVCVLASSVVDCDTTSVV